MGILARGSFLLRYGCCAEAVIHAQEKQDREEQREGLARVVGRSRCLESHYLVLIPPESKGNCGICR